MSCVRDENTSNDEAELMKYKSRVLMIARSVGSRERDGWKELDSKRRSAEEKINENAN